MFRGIGLPFAHVERVIAPIELFGSGNVTGWAEISKEDDCELDQIGLGNVDVSFFVPQPTRVIALANKNARRASWV